MFRLEDCHRRVQRAKLHRDAFEQGWLLLMRRDLYEFVPKDYGNSTGAIRCILKERPENDLPLELGEFFYQLRAALDGAVYGAAMHLHGDPPPNEGALEFPFCATTQEFSDKRTTRRIEPLTDTLRLWIETVQPYNAAKTAHLQMSYVNDALKLLHDCARKDRHRRLHIVGSTISSHSYEIFADPPARITFVKHLNADILKDESEVIQFGFDQPSAYVNVKGKLFVDVSIAEIPGATGPNLDALLQRVYLATQFVVEGFEKLLNL